MSARALLLLFAAFPAQGGVLTAKEYICKDPDTGTLHTLNSTWPSTTFCGNYTCKLRNVNKTLTQPTSTIIVNLTLPEARSPTNNDNERINQQHKEKDFALSKILSELTEDNDRLLNKEEVQKISEILPSIKKSDLQAIVELYSVAQEIYSGMNSDSPDKGRASETELQDITNTGDKKSYWYEPMSGYRKDSVSDMKPEGSEYTQTVAYTNRNPYEYFYAQRPSSYSYFSGTLLNSNDFGRIGYNNGAHPQWHSYYQQRGTYDASRSMPSRPCTPCSAQYQYQVPLTSNTASKPHYSPSHRGTDNMLQPYYYNVSQHYANYANNYYKGNPWAYYDYYRNYPHPATTQFQRNPYPNTVNDVPPAPQQKDTDENSVESKEDDKPWKTAPLSDEVINEVKANIPYGKLLNIPLKKRIKLERASKVIKLDSFKNRQTRSVSNEENSNDNIKNEGETQVKTEEKAKKDLIIEEEVETYIEKITCPFTEEPGFYGQGNLSQPFPYCCPQKIEDKQR